MEQVLFGDAFRVLSPSPQSPSVAPANAGVPLIEMKSGGWVYMMNDRYCGGLYTGVTADLPLRAYQHRTGQGSQFVKKYGFHRLVFHERHEAIEDAIRREKAIKKWRRAWKVELIEKHNSEWIDLFDQSNE